MTVKKTSRTGGYACIVARQKLSNNQQFDATSLAKTPTLSYNVVVGFNEKDQLQLATKDDTSDDDKKIKEYEYKSSKYEIISIDEISNCVNIENYPNCESTLVFYVTRNSVKEAIVIKFENDQDFKRIYFTYKYFKMRNRLTQNNKNYTNGDSLFSKKKNTDLFSNKNRKDSLEDYSVFDRDRSEYDLMQTVDNDGVTHISVQQKVPNSRFDQPLSLIGIRNDFNDSGEIDSVIYTDLDVPIKPERRLFHKKAKAPQPPAHPKDNQTKVLKGEFVRVNVDKIPDVIPRDSKVNRMPDILTFKDSKSKRSNLTSNLWSASNKVTGYESDREEWRSSRSQFSTTAFDSLTRPTKAAMALTLRKPQRLETVPQYFRLPSEPKPKLTPLPFRPNNFLARPPRLPRPTEIKRNLSIEHRKYTSLQNLDLPMKLSEPKKQIESKKTQLTITNRITGLTNKLRDLGSPGNSIGRFKAQSHSDVANLKPVLKSQDGAKRPVVRTCSAEPPKKVTFSAFATVQVV